MSSEANHKFEYLDHTADIQFHSWGDSLKEAFEQVVLAMYSYMTDISKIDVSPQYNFEVSVEGHDLESLLYNYMDEFLYQFNTEFIAAKEITIIEFDRANFRIKAVGRGEPFDKVKHTQGTEIKAITYSNMQIHEDAATGKCDVYVIVDI